MVSNRREAAKTVVELQRLKAKRDALDEEINVLQSSLVSYFGRVREATLTFKAGGVQYKATKVQGSRVVIDDDRLQKALGAQLWNKVTKKVLDQKRLNAAITTGDVDATTVAECSEVKQNNPYVKITQKKMEG